ncbi:MAG TPA: exodeoxyribonuclease VII large subunit [Mycobacteriales bacterium]|nr:exodeoxyribonuclease VII large subunit [Mycobacteriales bacterium]
MPLESSPEQPLPVRTVARAIGDWVGRLGRVWVEGQVTQLTRRPGQSTCFLVLRDPVAEMSLQVACPRALLDQIDPPLAEGGRVVVWAKPEFRPQRGTLSLTAYDVRPVGIGALLARLEQLRQTLAAEGLFAPERKRPLPFLPRTVGLVTGRASAAERDVVENARRRWPAVQFRIENVAVQGAYAVTEVLAALQRLDADPDVDVIVIARGGGSVEDLLPFSDETLVRAVVGCRAPVVTAVGHESDVPLVDHAADRRASTPTDAAKLVVPDMAEELHRVQVLRGRALRCVRGRVETELHRIDGLRSRPVLAAPQEQLMRWSGQVEAHRERARRAALACVGAAGTDIARLGARVTALSPQATLERGYAVLQRADGTAVRDPAEVAAGDRLTARVARGRIPLEVASAAGS